MTIAITVLQGLVGMNERAACARDHVDLLINCRIKMEISSNPKDQSQREIGAIKKSLSKNNEVSRKNDLRNI